MEFRKDLLKFNLLSFIVMSILVNLFFIGIESPLIFFGDKDVFTWIISMLILVMFFYRSNFKLIRYENKVT